MFNKILIANRGEIACRVIRTAEALGVKTVAVYSDADRYAEHVRFANESVYIGPSPSTQSYLRGDRIIDACKKTGAQAVHPGYGFLSENLNFCQMCSDANIVFIGPPPSAIEAMGSKSRSKDIMIAAGVPVTPGYHGKDNSDANLLNEAKKIGWPVMIKAVSGGGGKGMRTVHNEKHFLEALESCRREAMKSFGDSNVLLEKLVLSPRHVEFQVFGDTFGNVVHLLERDCSIQRRHQKVLEEAPAPGLDPTRRREMGEAAVACAKAVGYVGAGTVEFLVDPVTSSFYFCEMNTRLQVEHPVTELVTGVDLVEWQLRIASGQPLPLSQAQILQQARGCAVEARIYAENPLQDFLPATGRILHMHLPAQRQPQSEVTVRVDSGVVAGSQVSSFYDPMVAKLIVHAASRPAALQALEEALRDFQVAGLPTNIAFLVNVVRHPAFAKALPTTAFFDHHLDEILLALQQPAATSTASLSWHMQFALLCFLQASLPAQGEKGQGIWEEPQGSGEFRHFRVLRPQQVSRLLQVAARPVSASAAVQTLQVTARHSAVDPSQLWLQSKKSPADLAVDEELSCLLQSCQLLSSGPDGSSVWRLSTELQGQLLHATVSLLPRPAASSSSLGPVLQADVWLEGRSGSEPTHQAFWLPLHPPSSSSSTASSAAASPLLQSPMPGKVVKLSVTDGQEVAAGQALLVLEAMKMEHVINAPCSGIVRMYCSEGQSVSEGSKLAEIVPIETSS